MRGSALALALPEATEAHGCPQFERPCLLMTGDLERLVKASLCLSFTLRRNFEQQLPLEPIQLCLAVTPSLGQFGQRLMQHKQPFLWLAHFPIRFREQGKRKQVPSCASGPVRSQALAYLCNSLRSLSLLNQRPAPENGPMRQVERDLVLCRQREGCLRPLSCELSFSAV